MKIVKLRDRQGSQVSPQTHIDSVMNSEGKVLDELYAPLTHVGSYGDSQHKVVDKDGAGFMSPAQLTHLENVSEDTYCKIVSDTTEMPANGHDTITFQSGRRIDLIATAGANKVIKIDHESIETPVTPRTSQAVPGQAYTVIEGVSNDDAGHMTGINQVTVSMPVQIAVNTLTSDGGVINLIGTSQTSGNQDVKSSSDLTYNPLTQILSAPIINANMVGGAKGSIPYQNDANQTTFVGIGTEGQILKSVSGIPSWTNDKGVKSYAWNNGTSEGPTVTTTLQDDSTVTSPAIPSASDSVSGIVTTEAQTFSGIKTFNDGIVAHVSDLTGGDVGSLPYQDGVNSTAMLPIGTAGYVLTVENGIPSWKPNKGITSYSWTAGTTEGPILNSVLADGTTVSTPAVPSASSTASGVITTGQQLIAGNKEFLNNVKVDGDLTVVGNLYSTQEHDLIISDKRVTLAYTDSPSVETANGSGIEVTTYADANETDPAQKYHGPSLLWYSDKGWSTENTDPNTARSLDINLGGEGAVYRINGVQVLSSTQFIGNSATADKVNHTITYHNGSTFNGSADVTVNYDTVGASIKNHASTSTEFGVASTTEYGHVKIGNGIVPTDGVITLDYGTTATNLASASSAGTSVQVSRADHVHPLPSLNDCTNILSVAKGGTGASSLSLNCVLIGNGVDAVKTSNLGTNGQFLQIVDGVPTFDNLSLSQVGDIDDLPRISDTGLTCDDFTF